MTGATPLADAHWLLLHGTPLTPAVWDDVAPHLRQIGSVWCPQVTPTSADHGAQDAIAQRLIDALPGEQPPLHVVGHSYGGQIALEFALAAPRLVRTLTVVCSRDSPFPPFAAAAAALRQGEPVDVEAALGRWFTAAELAAHGAVVGYARACLENADRRAWADALAAIASYDRSRAVGRIRAPTTLVAAALDHVSTPTAVAELAGRLPRARLQVLADAAHMTPFVDPASLAQLLRAAAAA